MIDTEDFFWFRLSRLPGIGPKTLWRLNAAAEARSLALHELIAGTAGPVGEREVPRIQALLVEQDTAPLAEEHAALQSRRVSILHPDHSCFPSGVTRHGNEFGLPPVLFARGHLPLARATGVAIVGSRTIEEDGIEFAHGLAAELAGEGLNVVSGFAKGADRPGIPARCAPVERRRWRSAWGF